MNLTAGKHLKKRLWWKSKRGGGAKVVEKHFSSD